MQVPCGWDECRVNKDKTGYQSMRISAGCNVLGMYHTTSQITFGDFIKLGVLIYANRTDLHTSELRKAFFCGQALVNMYTSLKKNLMYFMEVRDVFKKHYLNVSGECTKVRILFNSTI